MNTSFLIKKGISDKMSYLKLVFKYLYAMSFLMTITLPEAIYPVTNSLKISVTKVTGTPIFIILLNSDFPASKKICAENIKRTIKFTIHE